MPRIVTYLNYKEQTINTRKTFFHILPKRFCKEIKMLLPKKGAAGIFTLEVILLAFSFYLTIHLPSSTLNNFYITLLTIFLPYLTFKNNLPVFKEPSKSSIKKI